MGWTTPATFVDGTLMNAAFFNPQVRDNLGYLLNRTNSVIKRNNAGDYTTTSTTFVDIDATNLTSTLTLVGAAALVSFAGMAVPGADADQVYFDILAAGVRYGSANGIVNAAWAGSGSFTDINVAFTVLVTGLTPGSVTFKPQWRTNAGTATLRSNANQYVHFSVQEVS